MQCIECGADLDNDGRFCTHCGQAAVATPASANITSEPLRQEPIPGVPVDPALAGASSDPMSRSGRALSTEVSTNGHDPLTAEDLTGRALAATPDAAVKLPSGTPPLAARRLTAQATHALLTQANLDRLRGKFYEATERCVTVLRSEPGNQTAHSLLGDIYRDQGKLDDAIQWYRLSLDLNPNPADRAKLAQTERERTQNQAASAQIGRRGSPGSLAPDPLDAAAGLQAGTSPLLGQSPRFWLRGLWAASLAFLILTLVLMTLTHPSREPRAVRKTGGFGASLSQPPPTVPPMDPPHLTDTPRPAPSFNRTPPVAPFFDRQLPSTKLPAATLPTAPVVDVKPLTSGAPVRPPLDTPPPPTHEVQDGMRVEQVWDAGNGETAILVTAPAAYTTDASDAARDKLIRNVFRAAQGALTNSAASVRARVFIQVQSENGTLAILQAELDRDTALAANADTASVDSLQSRLRSLKWPARGLTGSTAGIGR